MPPSGGNKALPVVDLIRAPVLDQIRLLGFRGWTYGYPPCAQSDVGAGAVLSAGCKGIQPRADTIPAYGSFRAPARPDPRTRSVELRANASR